MKQLMSFNINGQEYERAVSPNTTLIDFLREDLGLTGVKKGCNDGDCGACTVLLDGKAVASCTTLAAQAQNRNIVTIEGLSKNGVLSPIQRFFVDKFAVQCGFCTPGMILTSVALLEENPNPTEDEIRDAIRGNICRCTGYVKIIDAIMAAAEYMNENKNQQEVI